MSPDDRVLHCPCQANWSDADAAPERKRESTSAVADDTRASPCNMPARGAPSARVKVETVPCSADLTAVGVASERTQQAMAKRPEFMATGEGGVSHARGAR